ncbi:MAG TPA: glycoside hydrolase family 3 N-terminal domain-containing protein [Microbacteriaceae bacterium]|nr:glycoside hydrolase family 3 N-terminal domain-containing protein [Microbacteriaceae bacterium]
MSAHDDPSLIRLVNGVLWPGFEGHTAPDWLNRALEHGLAGVVYFGHNVAEHPSGTAVPAQVSALSAELRGIRPNVLIGADEEGGNVTRLEAEHGSSLPSAAQLGRVDDVALTHRVWVELGRRLTAAGINLGIAPVADVNTDKRNPVIGVRSFGADAGLVSRHVVAAVSGMQSTGIAACVKHFPGHGDTHTDSHHDLPRLDLSWAQIERDHLPPFFAAVEAGVRVVMTAHIVVPELGNAPATLNPRILGSLRSHGFEGVIVTDALDMAAIRSTVGAGPGAVAAINAGADLLCIGNPSNLGPKGGTVRDVDDYREVRDALLDALDDGTLSTMALEGAAERVRMLAESVAEPADVTDRGADDVARSSDAAAFASAVRSACSVAGAVPAFENAHALTVLDLRRAATIAVASTADAFSEALARRVRVTRTVIDVTRSDANAALAEALAMAGAELAVVLVDAVGTDGPQRRALDRIASIRPDSVAINSGVDGRAPVAMINTFGAGILAADAATELLLGSAGENDRGDVFG